MSDALKKRLESRIRTAERVIATKRATIERARMDLADLADADARLSKQRQKVIRRAGAARVPSAKDEAPESVMDLPAAAPVVEETVEKKTKPSWSLFT